MAVQFSLLDRLFSMANGMLTHVGYWTGPSGFVFPVFDWSECTSISQLQQYISSKSIVNIGDAPLGVSPIKGTIYGDKVAYVLANINTVFDNSETIVVNGIEYVQRSRGIVYSGVNAGYETFVRWSRDDQNIDFGHVNYRATRDVPTYDQTMSDGAGAVILRVPNNGNYIFFRVLGRLHWDGTLNSQGKPLDNGYVNFSYTHTQTDAFDDLFGIPSMTITETPDGTFTPGTTPPSENPYPGIDPSVPSGGGGNFDDTSDPIPDSSTPTLSSANTGFTRIYNPSLAQVQALANYLWTDESVITTIWNHIKQYFEDPMQAIIGFNLVPVPVPNGGTEEFKLMYIGTGVQMTVAANQFVDVDCGTLTVEKYYGSALDYSPYTKISCFLPFIGNVDLNPDEVMDTTLQIKYRVDICSGSCVAKILVNGTVLYQYSGHCAIPIPLASSDFASYVSAAVSVAKLAIGAAVAGGAGAAAAASTEAGQATGNTVTTTIQTTARNPETGRQITTGTQTITQTKQSQDTTKASFDGLSPKNISNTVGEIMTSKPTFQHSGSFSGNTGYLGIRRPYLIITRPNLCMPASYQSMNGFPCMITLKLGDCKGFTQVQQCILSGFTATNPEQSEILQLLKSGVIL